MIVGVTPSILPKLTVSPDAKAVRNGPRDAFGRPKGNTASAIFGARFADNWWLKIALSGVSRCRLGDEFYLMFIHAGTALNLQIDKPIDAPNDRIAITKPLAIDLKENLSVSSREENRRCRIYAH